MINELPSGYKFVPVNKALLVETISDDIFDKEILGIDPDAPVTTPGGMIIPAGFDIDHDKTSFTMYAKGRVIDVATDCEGSANAGDIVIYNIGGTIYRDRATGAKVESVPESNVIVVLRKKLAVTQGTSTRI